MNTYLSTLGSFLSHGGFKLLIIGFFLVMKVVKSNAKKAQQNEAQLRGNTGISDFSSPEKQTPLPSVATIKTAPKPVSPSPNPAPGSPWSSNQNPFN